MPKNYDFSGWATRNDIRCSDGRTIRQDAFKDCDGQTVPLVWNHMHNEPFNVLGHALLENRKDGVYTYCTFNDTESGRNGKLLVEHGDVVSLSIYANQLKQNGGDVIHGTIREVSLVLAGANPEAMIDNVLSHGESLDEEAIIYTGEELSLSHAEEIATPKEEKKEMAEEKEPAKKEEKTVKDVFDTFNEEQKTVVYAILGWALEDAENGSAEKDDDDDEGGNSAMKHNVFDQDAQSGNYLSHADFEQILKDAKRLGSLKEAVNEHLENGVLAHAIDTTDMETATGTQTYGFNDPNMLFPDYRTVGGNTPEWLSREMTWVKKVMNSVHHTPFSRIKSLFANITEDEARAKGYIKGKLKKEEVFTTLKRTTDPQTVYKKQKMDRDDIIDITDFDVIAWLKSEMRMMLDEELARAFLIGDGRQPDADDKIQPAHIRPIATDVPLFNTKVDVTVEATADEDAVAKAVIRAAVKARKNYKGSGNPTFFTTEDYLTDMLLLEDDIGHKIYKTEAELATALRVREIVTVEPMEDAQVDGKPLVGIIVNMADYNVGADKGGEVNMFDDFDIDYNQQKYLIETRCSGALVKPFSALTLLLNKTGE